MIPITLRAPCNYCGVVIVATSMHDFRNHICSNEKNIQVSTSFFFDIEECLLKLIAFILQFSVPFLIAKKGYPLE